MEYRTLARTSSEENQRERDNRALARRAADESIVLLKNDGALPLVPGRLALYGAGARRTVKGGTGSGEVNERRSVSIAEGLETAGFTLTSGRWLDDYDEAFRRSDEAYGEQLRRRLLAPGGGGLTGLISVPFLYPAGREVFPSDIAESGTDACVYVVARQAGEGSDRSLARGENTLCETELASIRRCAAAYAKFILVLNTGSSLDLSCLDGIPGIDALLYFCQQGSEGGSALADILRGAVSPSGRLAATWAERYEDWPCAADFSYLNGNTEQEYYKEGIYVGYRYFDRFGVRPRYPFGFGLSYTSFSLTAESAALEGPAAELRVRVRNTGDAFAAREVVQLYASCPDGRLKKEYQRLCAFAKTRTLAPGEEETLPLRFDARALASYDEAASAWVLEPGRYVLRLGASSRDTVPCAVLTLADERIVERCAPVCRRPRPVPELDPPAPGPAEDLSGVPALALDAGTIPSVTASYDEPPIPDDPAIRELLATLSPEDKISLTVGAGFLRDDHAFHVPGAVGFTTSAFASRGLPCAALADGPAGLRLARRSALTKRGKLKMIDPPFRFMSYLPEAVKKRALGDPERDTVLYQHTTAFPVETALAQSWDVALLEEVGRAVAAEMDEYGVTWWLAPAMNIQRNPLCGRNFEYFSEDPFLTGALAAAVTRGVQSRPGHYATLKHFACNNQETNRTGVSAEVNERALREIYLQGFSIAVREGKAKSVMTSYNRINGVYTANSRDLCTRVLRCEWGFDGVVMTDWFSTARGQADAGLCLAAGNDLLMPGTDHDRRAILHALMRGLVDPIQIRACASRVVRAVLGGATPR